MTKFALALLEHPTLFTITLLAVLGFVGMTYEFLLRLFGKKTLTDDVVDEISTMGEDGDDDEDDTEIVKVKEDDSATGDDIIKPFMCDCPEHDYSCDCGDNKNGSDIKDDVYDDTPIPGNDVDYDVRKEENK